MLGHSFDALNITMDAVLVGVGVLMAITAAKISLAGAVGSTVRSVVIGAVVLGLAHVIETVLDQAFGVPVEANEFIHRIIILVGFGFLYFGIRGLAKSLSGLRSAQAKR